MWHAVDYFSKYVRLFAVDCLGKSTHILVLGFCLTAPFLQSYCRLGRSLKVSSWELCCGRTFTARMPILSPNPSIKAVKDGCERAAAMIMLKLQNCVHQSACLPPLSTEMQYTISYFTLFRLQFITRPPCPHRFPVLQFLCSCSHHLEFPYLGYLKQFYHILFSPPT